MTLSDLYDMAMARHRPEDVAEAILRTVPHLPERVRTALRGPASQSLRNKGWELSSMATDFFEAIVNVAPQCAVASTLFEVERLPPRSMAARDDVIAFVSRCATLIGGLDVRLTKAHRHALGIYKGHRWYNKRRRLLLRICNKLERQLRNDKRNALRRASKTVLLSQLRYDDFAADELTACFIAYFASRLGRRSVFTCHAQERPFDDVCDAMLSSLSRRKSTRWFAVAHVMADRAVVKRLTEQDRGRLMGAAYEQLADAADILETVWAAKPLSRADMMVHRGFDSSTWNEAAGGWNKLRESWISLVHALGMHHILESQLPGKVMRAMAADVVRWHRMSGGGIHPDTRVWAALPLPWEVLRGDAKCTSEDVRKAVAYAQADADGWLGPRTKKRTVVKWSPTPELVHGVAVSSPRLASALKKAGVFSGKAIAAEVPPVAVHRDALGFAIGASEVAKQEDRR